MYQEDNEIAREHDELEDLFIFCLLECLRESVEPTLLFMVEYNYFFIDDDQTS